MADAPKTRPSLLLRIRDARDGAAWAQFVQVYAPLIYAYARKHGLQDGDAADVTQESLGAVAGAVRGLDYDPRRGSFRGWLFAVVRNRLRGFWARQDRPGRGSGDSAAHDRLREVPARAEDPDELWEQEYERRRFAWAAERVREQVQDATWQAFRMTAVEGKSGQEVAQVLGMTVAAVYLAKSRVMARLKEQIKPLQEVD